MSVWIIIGGVASMVAIFSGLILWIGRIVKTVTTTAYDKGVHAKVHEKNEKDIGAAHRRLDTVEGEVSELAKVSEAHTAIHTALMEGQKHINNRLDSIYDFLVKDKK